MAISALVGREAYLLIPGAQVRDADTQPNNGDVVTVVAHQGGNRYTVEYADGERITAFRTMRMLNTYIGGYPIPVFHS